MEVVIAEDDLVSRRLLEGLLKKNGYTIDGSYDNGQTTLERLCEPNSPSIALLDWEMPIMNGLEVCKELIAQNKKEGKYLMMVTQKISERHLKEAFKFGIDDYIKKPYNDIELLSRLLVAKRSVLSYRKIVDYTRELESLVRRNNLLGQIKSKKLDLATADNSENNSALSPEIADTKAVRGFNQILINAFEGIGLETVNSIEATKPLTDEAFIAWAPLYAADKGRWLEILIEADTKTAKAITGEILDSKNPDESEVLDILAEIGNMTRGSFKPHLENENLDIATPFIPKAKKVSTAEYYNDVIDSKMQVSLKIGKNTISGYIFEHAASPIKKKITSLQTLDLVCESLTSRHAADQVLLKQWTPLNDRFVDRLNNWVESEMIDKEISVVEPSNLAKKVSPTV